MTTADSPKKRKRALSPLPTRKIPLHSGESQAMEATSEKIMTMEEETEKALAEFRAALDDEQAIKQYDDERNKLVKKEEDNAWDQAARSDKPGSEDDKVEKLAADIIRGIREYERNVTFGNVASEALPEPEDRDMGGQYLTNKDRIDRESKLFEIARIVPKGALLHLHFNAALHPELLLVKARRMKNMYIRSIRPIADKNDLALTEVVFNILDPKTVDPEIDIFSDTYPAAEDAVRFKDADVKDRIWMLWSKFQEEFEKRFPGLYQQQEPETFREGRPRRTRNCGDPKQIKLHPAENWLRSKMVLSEDEAYGPQQTVNGVWARFNQATRAFKGLLNYESVYKEYIGEAIDRMIVEKIMYAELRPMLLDKSIPSSDGRRAIDNFAQMQLIIDGVREKKAQLEKKGEINKFPFGLKIVYCTPRSIPPALMRKEMEHCIELKMKFPELICGFDLVGAEDRPNHIGFYKKELKAFQKACKEVKVEIPFMFHAGETLLDTGGSAKPENSNLYDAVALGARRIGHGFALLKHPHLVEEFKKSNICVELCPISNELLHLCRNVKEHPYPELLAAGIPCTVNSDNPSLFNNSMSHEFYQIMVGAPTMSLYSWKQLARWSIEYSCLDTKQQKDGRQFLDESWSEFCQTIVKDYGGLMSEDNPREINPYRAEVAYGPRKRIHPAILKAESDKDGGPERVKVEREKAEAWKRSLPSDSVVLVHSVGSNQT
ncbi:metallo-dependent hydrolase [Alternaria burnsii]|uniref:Metallo-dependent hydrolase n=1 Tax=Alternaria burnsii TaxID=1187904 RepID=A0A8H7BFX0_9PLEO|nr:metallo-dependent hydrolase [Alternaria burnsii]KAF7678676.1 metallo-dependent hydrolase [Alternaria burnsii]